MDLKLCIKLWCTNQTCAPFIEMILEDSFVKLVKEIWGETQQDATMREVGPEWWVNCLQPLIIKMLTIFVDHGLPVHTMLHQPLKRLIPVGYLNHLDQQHSMGTNSPCNMQQDTVQGDLQHRQQGLDKLSAQTISMPSLAFTVQLKMFDMHMWKSQ